MNLYDFDECAKEAEARMQQGFFVFQQFNCAHCGVKQTIDTPNVFHTHGTCEGCGKLTDIKQDGCNYMLIGRGPVEL